MKKFSFLSGFTALTLLFTPLSTGVLANTFEEELQVTEDVYGDVTEDVYGDVTEDVYADVIEDVYGGVTEDVYEDVIEDVYGDVTEDVYEDVIEDVYGDVTEDVYEDVIEDVYGGVTEDVYEDVIEDVYGEITEDVYEDVIEDVYGDITEDVYEDVIEDVYYDAPYIPENITENITFDYSNLSNQNLAFVIDVAELSEEEKNHSVVVNKGDVSISIPLSIFPEGKFYTLSVVKKSYAGALGTVYDFVIVSEDGEVISQFPNNPVTLTFVVDPSKVTNWDNLRVVYINAAGVKTSEVITPISVDKNTGKVVAKVTHFSSYGVFEVASATAGTNNGTVGSTTGSGGPVTTTVTSTVTKTGSSTVAAATTAGTTAVAATATTATTPKVTGNALPNTATNSYNMLLAGLLIVAFGGVLLIVKLRREMQVQ